MSKITFRADDALVERLDRLDTSKSEVMREALRQYLDELERDDGADAADDASDTAGLDGALSARVEELVDERLDEQLPALVEEAAAARESERPTPSDLNVNINVDGSNGESRVNAGVDTESTPSTVRKTRDELESGDADDPDMTCGQCGESVGPDHVYCPNCGEKTSHRVFCECGDELRSDWAFCPDCGRRTPAADVLEQA
ncbi:double zinc ribbon domain-containing protein [Haloferax volcanii]|uniref:Ribbon-helix-helix protein, CopG family n=3 Tax=Haloferax volcanii TaxID=2246 RepID=A0A6C0UPR1_HALVO|nr:MULTISPECIES: zinc ribbon domain-containing protein [Haloferax]ELZ70570.1 ribbon-helix-helix CopG family protein [Haloferax lucentense DSM 14919]ELZ92548.1 ribbon-helix-helix CopG family protein [Haloferax alexandrinus JCM 10717]NLV01536.1 ribbon-helix-helix protein, CopG family [Haloferax alexandrinus]QIB77160.1 ribbon-helix-helix protein, CopG family [Haloferax alexandrinus]TVT92802.1 ribbon-helix-helix protein, CopG family [Haloferax volcanii]